MSKSIQKLSLCERHESNPFVEKVVEGIRVVKRTQVVRSADKSDIQLIVDSNGEAIGHSAFMRFVEVDDAQFVKVYLSQFAAFWELGKPAIRVFSYILNVLKPGQDVFTFKMAECLKHTQYQHKKMVFEGLANLIDCGIIARTKYDFEYFLNPLVVFNGDRVTFAKTYIRRRKEAADKAQLQLPFTREEVPSDSENG